MLGVRADGRADVEHDGAPAQGRPQRRERRTVDLRHGAQADFRHGHEGAGIAGRDRAIGLAVANRLDRLPHRRIAPARAQRLARLVGHADGDAGVAHLGQRRQPGLGLEQGRDLLLVAEHQEFDVGKAFHEQCRARNDDRRAEIPAHGVERDPYRLFHTSPDSDN